MGSSTHLGIDVFGRDVFAVLVHKGSGVVRVGFLLAQSPL